MEQGHLHNRLYKGMPSFNEANTDPLNLLNFNLLNNTVVAFSKTSRLEAGENIRGRPVANLPI